MKRVLSPIVLLILLAPVIGARAQAERRGLRLIVVSAEAEATALRAQILAGESFEALAREHSTDASSKAGGYLGTFPVGDLRREFQTALAGLKPGEVSAVTRIGSEFALLQFVTDVADVLDSFAALLSLAYFRDAQFEEALKKYEQAVSRAPLSEDLYLAMNNILSGAELRTEAETLMMRALGAFPGSRRVRYRLAELYRDSGRMRKALEVFKEAAELEGPPGLDPALDRRQRSFIYQRIGGINTDLVQFDDALSAHKKALEIDPGNAESRVALGDLYVRRDRLNEALAEYTSVAAANPKSAAAHNRVAEVNLQLARLPESAAAAGRALEIDPAHRRSRYVRAMALIRMGRNEEGQKELQQYEKLEGEAQAETNEAREIVVTARGAAALLIDGKAEEAIAMFRKGVEAHPKATGIHLNLGLAESKLGLHREAAKTFETLIDLGLDGNFLVHWNLSREYKALGDTKASERHQILYLQTLNAALEAGLN
ncbi:MAG: tetratricopeptide repeat protein [Acidobacteria bacterium]|nr:tetratricopeptide repeat protein [Acidobacteriota bacterium]